MSEAALETVLAERHRKNRAEVGVWFGCALPTSFGNWESEYWALKQSLGLIDKNYRAYLDFTGPDRARYLNAILTNDIKGLKENHGSVSLFLNPQGHIQAEIEAYAFAENTFCVSYAMIRERLVAALDKYIIMDDVTLTDRTDEFAAFALEGPNAAAVVEKISGVALQALEELEMRDASVGGIPCRVSKRSPGGLAGAEFLVEHANAEELWNQLEETTHASGGSPAGYQALNAVRLEQGTPWFSYDFGEKQIPHEAGLENSHISYTKGCYTGQEIVERVRSRGQVNRVRVSLRFDGTQAPAPGSILLSEGKEIGFVTRVGYSAALKANIGMGYARREHASVGAVLEVGEGRATVVTAPVA